MKRKELITVKGVAIATEGEGDYICLTDMSKAFPDKSIEAWLRSKSTLEFLEVWERMNNPAFKLPEFDGLKSKAGQNSFTLSTKKWVESTAAVGIQSKSGRYGGTYAHKDIALHFAMYLSAEFNLLVIREVQRLKEGENGNKTFEWQFRRRLVSSNYRIQTDAIRDTLEKLQAPPEKGRLAYINEAEVLNIALFNKTSKKWRNENPELAKQGNMRDFASTELLIVMEGLAVLNAAMIREELPREERITKLRKHAIRNLKAISNTGGRNRLAA